MRSKFFFLNILFILLFSLTGTSQSTSPEGIHPKPATIWEIPHNTISEKWMWIHRSFAFIITKERPINYDTNYFHSYYKKLVVTLPISTRFLKFSLIDSKTGNQLTFAPNLQYNLGISISSRWASFILNSGVKLFNSDKDIKGTTKFQDYQLNIYGRKITTDMFVQNYKGFYIKNSRSYNNYISDKPYEIREDVNAFHMGVSSYYVVNHRRFSYGNSFAFVEQQKKSAGSLLIGVYYSYFEASGDPSLVSDTFKSSIDSLSYIRKGHTHDFGFNLGYIYTLVFLKKCYATASVVQGIGGNKISYVRDNNSAYHQLTGGAGKLNVRLALGYDSGKYFIGTLGIFDYFLFKQRADSTFNYSFGKFMIYFGYRFSILKAEKKYLRHFKLADY